MRQWLTGTAGPCLGRRWRAASTDRSEWLTVSGYLLAALLGIGVAVTLLVGLLWLLTGILRLIAGLITDAAAWAGEQAMTHVITDPVRAYLTDHATGLGLDPHLLWWCWVAAGLILLALSWFGSTGARIGWVLIGIATAAMVYTATPEGHAAAATGVTVLAWGLLSVLAFAGAGRRPLEIHNYPPAPTLDRDSS